MYNRPLNWWWYSPRLRVTFISASFRSRIPWSTRSKALRKSMNKACTPFLSCELSVALNQFCKIQAKADTVDRSVVNACWLSLICRSELFNLSCSFSRTLANWGSIEVWQKSFSVSVEGHTLEIGVTKACLYRVGYLHWVVLLQMISWTTAASSSQKRFSNHAGISSELVAFLGFSCLNAALTWLIDGTGGGFLSQKRCYICETRNSSHVKVFSWSCENILQ